MPRYLFRGSYVGDGLKGLLKEGGSRRVAAARQLIEGLGGRLESFDFAFGGDDIVVIFELPDNVSATALSLAVNGSGAAHGSITVLLTAAEVDRATQQTVNYRPPGQ
jgi:uncharacterized protein with GYD domain